MLALVPNREFWAVNPASVDLTICLTSLIETLHVFPQKLEGANSWKPAKPSPWVRIYN